MGNTLHILTAEESEDVRVFHARVEADRTAVRRKPEGIPTRIEDGEFTLFSWNEGTTSVGVGLWLDENSFIPIGAADLHTLRLAGYPKADEALVALGDDSSDVSLLDRHQGQIRIVKTERVLGSSDDLWYQGVDWNPGVQFPARRKS